MTDVPADFHLSSGCTLADLVTHLSGRYSEEFHKLLINPATGELRSTFAVTVNNLPIERAAEMRRELHADDRVAFFHPVTGGLVRLELGSCAPAAV